MKKLLILMASLCIMLIVTACGAGTDTAQTEEKAAAEIDHQIQYRFVDREEGQKLLMSNTGYYDGFTENDLQFRLQSKDTDMEEYLAFSKDQVRDFSEAQKTIISETMDRIEMTAAEKGYKFPPLDEITFICTTMEEECGAGAYTHGTQIYVNQSFLDTCIGDERYEPYLTYLMAHELFHCLTRCNPDFRADMYKVIHFTVQEEQYELPPSVLEYFISNPDVEHHDAFATFEINGEPVDCFMAFATKKHFKKKGDNFFDAGSPVLVPADGTDTYYYPEDAANYDEVLGNNTDYTIDPEECMADNFGFLISYDEDGPEGKGYKSPEIIEGIRNYLQKN